jgi:hypothetical protein
MFFIYIGDTGMAFVVFSLGRVLFNTSTVELVSLIVVMGKSDDTKVCAYIKLVVDSMDKNVVAIAIKLMNRIILFMIF